MPHERKAISPRRTRRTWSKSFIAVCKGLAWSQVPTRGTEFRKKNKNRKKKGETIFLQGDVVRGAVQGEEELKLLVRR